jgi:hypothetical protein
MNSLAQIPVRIVRKNWMSDDKNKGGALRFPLLIRIFAER